MIHALPAQSAPAPTATVKMDGDVPLGFVLVEEDVSFNTKNLPLALMDEAVTDYSNKNIGEAAGDLKAACRILRTTQESKMNEKTARQMKVSADNLELVAKDLRGAKIKSVDSLKERLGQVAYYLSVARRANANTEWNRRQMKQAGYDLDAAATMLERSMEWSGKAHSSDNDATVKNSHTIAAKLISGNGWRDGEVKNALSELAIVTTAVGSKVLPEGFRAAEQPGEF